MKYKISAVVGLASIFAIFLQTSVSAKSWKWDTISPIWIFPFAFALFIFSETFTIKKVCKVHNSFKIFTNIYLMNLISFVGPLIFQMIARAPNGTIYSIGDIFDRLPTHIISIEFIIINFIFIIPGLYLLLRKDVRSRRHIKLMISLFVSSTASTLVIAVTERLICRGHYY